MAYEILTKVGLLKPDYLVEQILDVGGTIVDTSPTPYPIGQCKQANATQGLNDEKGLLAFTG